MDTKAREAAEQIDRLAQLVDEEMKGPPTARELTRFKNFNGVAPHLRPGPRHALYPSMSVRELLEMKAVIVYLLVREYGMELVDIKTMLRCQDVETIEKLLAAGDQVGPASAFATEMKEAVRGAAHAVVEAAPVTVNGEKERIALMVAPAHPKLGKLKNPEIKCVRDVMVFLLIRIFKIDKANVRALLGYPVSTDVWRMQCRGERLLQLQWPNHSDTKRMLTAARAFVAMTMRTLP
ncbi:MAG: hypothetical protein JWM68_3104 [Verrucomicrobiales bacterium]|nr:hypothetical protein [Verrucomicrobiales bacterium]